MKIKFALVAGLMLLSAMVAGADNITIHATGQPADEVFRQIARQSGKNFVYATDLLRGRTVSVSADNAPLETVLERMLRSTGIVYSIKGNNIILSRGKTATVAAKVTVSGFVREKGNGEPMVGALVRCGVGGGTVVAATNTMGFYSLTLPAGKYQVTASYLGYEPVTRTVDIHENLSIDFDMTPSSRVLREVEVEGSRNRQQAISSPSIGSINVGKAAIASTPVLFGESDVIKTLQLEPGVSAGIEGMAGMYVHGGNTDENMYMLDNIPLYQVNHLGGLFSAFNVEALRNVDFYKSSFPARYDGRLSSYMEVNTKDGSLEAHHGSARLGLTSGAFNIDGPIGHRGTSYSVALRRSWYDLLTIPAFAIANSFIKDNEEKTSVGYAFTDLNAKITHRFSERSKLYAMLYYGEDYLRYKSTWDDPKDSENSADYTHDYHHLRWGNIVGSAGWSYVLTPKLFGEFTAAYSRYASRMTSEDENGTRVDGAVTTFTRDRNVTRNEINDWILKADFDWRPHAAHRISFGLGYTFHDFMPARSRRHITTDEIDNVVTDRVTAYHAGEANAYAGGDWQPLNSLRVNYGAHFSIFNIEGHTHAHLSPRLSARWSASDNWSFKAGYARTVQYVHQLMQSSISLPTDQWVPVIGDQKPQTADKIAAGAYYSPFRDYVVSVEGYWKWMDNLLDYADEYYLLPPDDEWSSKLTPGKGTSKGIDFKISKEFGRFTGHISYSLMWADRQYAGRNGGRRFPARFDNRHKINIVANWRINDRWEVSGAWTGMSGNRITLPTQIWSDPMLSGPWHYDMLLGTDVNNFRLPFYHRLDLSFKRYTEKGYWTFSLYNAYCNMNTIAVRRDYSDNPTYDPVTGKTDYLPVFQKIKLIPVIPSVSYTWLF